MPLVVKRPRVLTDLAEIWDYIAEDSPAHADAFAALIDDKFHALARQPGIGGTRSELGRGLRSFAVGSYVIFYLSLSNGIDVVRVLHGARDIEEIFRDEKGP